MAKPGIPNGTRDFSPVEMARRVNAEHTYFIHMCHTAGKQAEMDEQLPEGVRFAYDGLTIEC